VAAPHEPIEELKLKTFEFGDLTTLWQALLNFIEVSE
jgi:hypothetical protein